MPDHEYPISSPQKFPTLSNVYDGLDSPMLHTKFCENRPAGSGEEDF